MVYLASSVKLRGQTLQIRWLNQPTSGVLARADGWPMKHEFAMNALWLLVCTACQCGALWVGVVNWSSGARLVGSRMVSKIDDTVLRLGASRAVLKIFIDHDVLDVPFPAQELATCFRDCLW